MISAAPTSTSTITRTAASIMRAAAACSTLCVVAASTHVMSRWFQIGSAEEHPSNPDGKNPKCDQHTQDNLKSRHNFGPSCYV
jgi:hypothetical protein